MAMGALGFLFHHVLQVGCWKEVINNTSEYFRGLKENISNRVTCSNKLTVIPFLHPYYLPVEDLQYPVTSPPTFH